VLAQHLSGVAKFQSEVTAEYIRLIYLTSPLHDIGKVGIPDCVLLKPGRLNDNEFEIMKTHAALGAQTLDAALRQFPGVNFLQMARDIAACHHERFDGTGYPNKMSGTSIPLCARIVALADVYDALTSKRVYKDAMNHQVARSMIVEGAGTHFDPDIVEAFVQNEARFTAIRTQFDESQAEAA
jgi:putative two-component system response regulator